MPWLIHCLCLWPLFGVIFSLFFPPLSSLSCSHAHVCWILVERFLIKCLSFISACGKVSKVVCCVSVSDLFLSLSSGKDSNLYLTPFLLLSCVGSLANPLPPQFHEQSVPLNVPMMLPNAPTCCTVSFDNNTFIQLFNTFFPMMPPNTRTCTLIQFRVKYFTWNSVTLQIEKIMMITLLS